MHFIKNIEILEIDSKEKVNLEYGIIADANIIGSFSYGPYYITSGIME